ncbi:unnamed protein product [Candidula unifasciata]|uniref:vitamin-K-epoxide reductase (warfarin-sensitive) n=1 Tax=Candidula unifasciata TaxID=100452 RepID=A0A8S3ZP21_9EUPU|nr:unnamed protein product [Candidula unifasciata]
MAGAAVKKVSQPRSSKYLRAFILVLCLLGLCISIFGLYIEILKEKNPNYVPFCDINSYIACSRALTSRYGKGFGLVDKFLSNTSILNQPNTVYGIAFYTFQATLSLSSSSSAAVVQTAGSVLANIGSVYLGYILYYIIRDFCLVCVSTYVVNFLLLIACIARLRTAVAEDIKKTVRKKK